MHNRKSREFMMQQEAAADWDRVVNQPRSAIADVHARGIGHRRLQLIVCPSFESAMGWEVRQLDEEWSSFRSDVVSDWPIIELVGYDRVAIDSDVLASLYNRSASLSLPIPFADSDTAYLDGTGYQLAIFGESFCECRFQWWSDPPANWKPLADVAEEAIFLFTAAARRAGNDANPSG
jgi:hypothetical protein